MGKVLYISTDWEHTGRYPPKYSGLSFGACLVDDPEIMFYRELRPISQHFDQTPGPRGETYYGMRVGCSSLECLLPHRGTPELDPAHEGFDPRAVLDLMGKTCMPPAQAMAEAEAWIQEHARDRTPYEAAAPIKSDGMFTTYYFNEFLGRDPLGHSGTDINSFVRGYYKDLAISIFTDLKLDHHAGRDAQQQARRFKRILEQMGVYDEPRRPMSG